MPSRVSKRNTSRRYSIFIVLLILILSFVSWYLFKPSEEAFEPRWDETNVGFNPTAEERAIEAQLPAFKHSRILEAYETRKQHEREVAIRKDEREKAAQEQKNTETVAAETEIEALDEAEQERAQTEKFDKELADYETALYFYNQDLSEQIDFLQMQVDTVAADPSYLETMDFAVSFDEGQARIFDIYVGLDNITPPSEYADFHMMFTDSVRMLSEGASTINQGVTLWDQAVIDEGLLQWGMAINFMQRAQQAAP